MERHGHRVGSRSSLTYMSWLCLKQRCDNPKNRSYRWYGAVGISYDPRWKSFKIFLAEMGERPSAQHTIGRKNHKLGYYKDNCEWQTSEQQHGTWADLEATMTPEQIAVLRLHDEADW